MSASSPTGKLDELRAQLRLNLEWARVGSEDLLRDYRKQRKAVTEGKSAFSSPESRPSGHPAHSHVSPAQGSSSANTIVAGQSLTLSEMVCFGFVFHDSCFILTSFGLFVDDQSGIHALIFFFCE